MPEQIVAAQGATAQPCRLMVIDDDRIQRTIIAKVAAQVGFDVVPAATFDDAARLLEAGRFDCITLDLSLGENNGTPLLRKVRDSDPRTPVIVISGAARHVLEATVTIANSLGLDSLPLAKPLNLADLRRALTQKRQNATSPRTPAQASQPASAPADASAP